MPILLQAPTVSASNDAAVLKYKHPPPYIPGPYTYQLPIVFSSSYLPPLGWLAINKLYPYPDQVHIGVRLNYHPPASHTTYDILAALIPSYSTSLNFEWANVDPRLWLTLVQIYDNLPENCQCYPIPLADEHLRLLQLVQPSPHFSLVTILELPGCRELLDSTIVSLKHLHSLCAFDASATSLSEYGIKILSETVSWSHEDGQTRKGPWGLRILRLRNCRNIDSKMFPHLSQFSLLSVLDVRGTQCLTTMCPASFHPAVASKHELFHPTPLRLALFILSSERPDLYSSSNVYTLYINTLHHPVSPEQPKREHAPREEACVTFNSGSSQFVQGSSKIPKPRKQRTTMIPVDGGIDPAQLHHIAQEELAAHAAQQDILSFYRSTVPPPRKTALKYTYPPEPLSDLSPKDALLMLFRSPPPWDTLEPIPPDAPHTKKTSDAAPALSKRKKAEMAQFTEQIEAKRRRIQEGEKRRALAPQAAPESSRDVSRNPFRRKASTGNRPIEIEGGIATSEKPLRSISSIAVPLLPSEFQKAVTTENLGKVGSNPNSIIQPITQRPNASPPRKPPVTKTPAITRKAGFDWNSWRKSG